MKAFLPASLTTLLLLVAASAQAHEHVTVHERFAFSIGWVTEPPVLDGANGVFLKVEDLGAAGHGDADAGHHGSTTGGHHGSEMPAHDFEKYGAVFMSADLAVNQTFNFTFDHTFANLSIPYHDHWTGKTGTVMVMMNAATNGTANVTITDAGFEPHMLSIAPDTVVTWTNARTGANDTPLMARVVSGPHTEGGHMHVDKGDAGAHATGTPIIDAETALKVEVSMGGKSRIFDLAPLSADEGKYAANFTPTVAGVYSVRVFGTLDGMAIDFTTDIERVDASAAPKWPEQGPGTFEATKELAKKDARIAELDAKVAELEAKKPTPGVGILAAIGAIGAVALFARRRS